MKIKINVNTMSYLAQFSFWCIIFSLVSFSAISAENTGSEAQDVAQTSQSGSRTAKYHIAAGDKLGIQVFGEDDLKLEFLVGEDGVISYPFLGEISVAGLAVHELESFITRGLKGTYFINPEVSVLILEYRPFFINGEVKNPGGYPYQPGLTLRKAIALAGGITERASLDSVTLIKEKESSKSSVSQINFNTSISPGDIISIRAHKQVFVDGEVKNPGSFDYQPGLTMQKLISLAGGFTERAQQEKVYVVKDGNTDKVPVEASLGDTVSPGDIITIKKSFF